MISSHRMIFIFGDAYSAPAVYVKENSGDWNIYYICRDYQGSITHVTDASGTVVQELSYDPWGRLRNPATQTVYATGSEPTPHLGRGYTGHEHLTWFGLINMNARLYDPALGRFLSPDPYVQAPDNTQNFNRYSYCLNNPLRYTDESGECLVAAIVVGAAMNVIMQGAMGNINSAKDYFVAMGIGALSGAAGFGAGALVGNALSTATTMGGSIMNGVLTNGVSGLASGFVCSSSNAWNNGADFNQGIRQGLIGGGIGGLSGAFLGGLTNGIQFHKQYNTFCQGCNELGINPNNSVPATDDFLDRAQQVWYKDAPMQQLCKFTAEDVSPEIQTVLDANKALAWTRPMVDVNGKLIGTSNMYFNKNLAFSSAKTLFYTMGHEFVHVSQFAALTGVSSSLLKDPDFIDMLEFHAYNYQNFLGDNVNNSFNNIGSIAQKYSQYFNTMSYTNFSWAYNYNFKYPF